MLSPESAASPTAEAKTSTRPLQKSARKKAAKKLVKNNAKKKTKAKRGGKQAQKSTKFIEVVWEPVPWRSYGPCVIGVDEVGRGCLAGPVYASAVLFSHDGLVTEVTDSKLLTEEQRESLSVRIRETHPTAIGHATVAEIDEINILWASLLAMRRAVELLEERLRGTGWAKHIGQAPIIVDGKMRIPGVCPERQRPLVKGDLRCAPVSAASIAAKVARDRHMAEQAAVFPQYGFEVHKGYGTPVHQAALRAHGPCVLHRRSFGTVKELLIRTTEVELA